MLERARQDRDDAAQRAQAEADLAATGVRVIDAPAWSDLGPDDVERNLSAREGH